MNPESIRDFDSTSTRDCAVTFRLVSVRVDITPLIDKAMTDLREKATSHF